MTQDKNKFKDEYFGVSKSKIDSILDYKRTPKEVEDYSYSDDDDPEVKNSIGFAFKLGILDTTRGIAQLTNAGKIIPGASFDREKMLEEQRQLRKIFEGPSGGAAKIAYFAGAILDPATWLIPFGKAKTLYQMGKYGMVSGSVAGAAGYVDEEADSIVGTVMGKDRQMTRGEQALFGAIGGGVLAPSFGALRNLGIKMSGSKKEITPLGQPDPDGFLGTVLNLKHVSPKKAVEKNMIKTTLPPAAKDETGVLKGKKRVFKMDKPRTAFARKDEDIGDPTADIQKTVVEKDFKKIASNAPTKGMFLGPVKTFFNKYVAKPYEEKIGRKVFQAISTRGDVGTSLGGAIVGYSSDDELPTFSFERPFSSRLGRAVTGAVFGLLGFRAITRKNLGFSKELRQVKLKPGSDEDAGPGYMINLTDWLGRGFIDKYNLPREFIRLRQNAQGFGAHISSQFKDLVDKAKLLTIDERKILYNILEGQEVNKVSSKKIKLLSKEAREIIRKYGQYYVDYGLLTKEKFKQNEQTYLRRIYADDKEVPLVGDDLKPRGDIKKVTKEEYEKTYKFEKATTDDGKVIKGHKGWELFDEIEEDGIKKVVIRWEYTKGQRLAKGEIEDAAAAIELTGGYMSSTIQQYKFYDDIAKTGSLTASIKSGKYKGFSDEQMLKEGYVRMPTTTIKDTKAKKYGTLSGKFVLKEIHDNLVSANKYREIGSKFLFPEYKKLNRLWKVSKTAWNPTVHVNNIFGNIFFTDMADVSFKNLGTAFKILSKHGDKTPFKSETVYLAQKYGVFDADFVTRELRTFDFKAIKDAYKYDSTKTEWWNAVNMAGKIYNAVKKNKVTGTLENWYRVEDHIFRLNAFIDRVQKGHNPSDAAMFARKYFIDYDIDAPIINALRHSMLPFFAFTYRSIPLLAEAAVVRPWKFAKYAAAGYALNKVGEVMGGGDAEKERQLLPKYAAGNILGLPILPYKEIKLPFEDDETGASKYINVQRFFPGGDLLDMSARPIPAIPAPLQPSFGIGGDIVFGMLGYDLFTQKSVQGRGVNALEDFSGALKNIGIKLIPNFPFLPGSYSTKRIDRTLPGRPETSPFRTKEEELQAILSSFGFKISDKDLSVLERTKQLELDDFIRKTESKIKDKYDKFRGGIIPFAEFENFKAKKIMEIREQIMIFQGRLQGISPAEIRETPEFLDLMNQR